jgi:phosphate ABC transporter permease subunit PstA/phosphate ABC transporter permease protein PstC
MKFPFKLLKKKIVNDRNQFHTKFNLREKIITLLLFFSASAAILISAAIIYILMEGSFSFFTDPQVNILDFFIGTKWVPSGGNPKFGILPLLSGTLLIAGGALLIGAPLGIGAALFLSEFAGNKLRSFIKPIVEILAGIPSIVYGFFALMFISPIFREYFGAGYFNAASAIIVMSIMILPIIVSISDDAMKAVPNHLRESSLALGATKWETATKVVMPAASSGITASVLLGLARAIGETMVVTLVAGSVARLTLDPMGEVQTITAYIAQVATGDIPPGVAVSAGFAVGLVLFMITYGINSIAARIVLRIKTGKTIKRHKTKKSFLLNILKRYISKLTSPIIKITKKIHKKITKIKNKLKKSKKITLKLRYRKGRIGVTTIGLSLSFAILFLIILLFSIFQQGINGININFLTSFPSYRNPSQSGILPVIIGSVYLMLLTMLFAAPIGVGAAVYLNEFARDTRYTRFLRRIIQNLAGVPSIVFGMMGAAIFVRMFGFGRSLLAGSLTLSIMALPIIIVSTEEALKSVPYGFREASFGVGSTKWQTVRHHVLPNAIPGILTGIILSMSRAIGETAPILFMGSLTAKTLPSSILDPFLALPYTIFYWTRDAKTVFHDLAASTIIVLLIILLAMNAIAIFIRQRAQLKRDW